MPPLFERIASLNSIRSNLDLLALAIGQVLVWGGAFYLFPAMLLQWEHYEGWSRTQLTGAFTLCLFVSALASPLAGRFIDRGMGPQMMFICTVVAGLSVAAFSQVRGITGFYTLWAILGLSFAGCLYEPCFALLTRARGALAKRSIIHVTLIAGFASSWSFPSAHYLTNSFGWRTSVLIFALVIVFVAAPLTGFGALCIDNKGDSKRKDQSHPRLERRSFLRKPAFWLLGVGFSLAGVSHGVTLHHLLPILEEREISASFAVLAASFIGPSQVAGRLIMMSLEKHLSNHAVAISCFVLLTSSILVLIFTQYQPLLLILFVPLFGAGHGIVSIIRPVITRDILGEASFGAKSGSLALLYLTGAASSPWLGSVVWRAGGYALVLPCLLALGILGLTLYCLAHRSNQATSSTSTGAS